MRVFAVASIMSLLPVLLAIFLRSSNKVVDRRGGIDIATARRSALVADLGRASPDDRSEVEVPHSRSGGTWNRLGSFRPTSMW